MHSLSTTFLELKPTNGFLRPFLHIAPVRAKVTTKSRIHPPPTKIHRLISNAEFLSTIFGLKPTGVKHALPANTPVPATNHHPRPTILSKRQSIPSNADFLATLFSTLQVEDSFKHPVVARARTTDMTIHHPRAARILKFPDLAHLDQEASFSASAQSYAPTITPLTSSSASPPINDTGNEETTISSATSASPEIPITGHQAVKEEEDGGSGADETESCGGIGIPMGENLSLFSSSHNSPCRVSESYDDDDDFDDNDEDNGVPIPGVRDLPLFPPSVSGALETHYGDDMDSDDDDNRVTIPGVRDLSLFPPPIFGVNQANCDDENVENDKDGVPIPGVASLSSFPPSAIGASQADYGDGDDDEDDDNGFLIPGENCSSLCSDSTPTSSSNGGENLFLFSSATTPPPSHNIRLDKDEPACPSSSSTAPPAIASQVLSLGDNIPIITSYGLFPLQHPRPVRILRYEIPFLTTNLWGNDGTFDPGMRWSWKTSSKG